MLFENNHRKQFKLTEDFVFHAVYGANTESSNKALIAVLNTLLGLKDDPIVEITILNPISYNSQPGDKQVIMDIKAITGKRVQIDVEMQNGNLLYYANRSIYYSGVMITNSLAKGESYDKMKRSIVITIVNGKLFKDIPDCYTQFAYADKKSHKILSDVSELHFLELGKIDISKPLEEMTSVEKLGAYLMIAGDESQEEYLQQLLNLKEEAINMSEYVFKELTEDDIARENLERQMKFEHDYATRMEIAKSEGEAIGEAKGEAEKAEMIGKLLKKLTVSEVAEMLEMTEEEVIKAAEGYVK